MNHGGQTNSVNSDNSNDSDDLHGSTGHTVNKNSDIKILSLNVCGVKHRLFYAEFQCLINKFDIVCFQETKLDDIDIIDCENFIFKYKNRKKISNYKSGGIAIGYKNI